MGKSKPGGGKEREVRHKSEPSLRKGGWGDNLISSVRFNKERNNQDKTGLFVQSNLLITDTKGTGISVRIIEVFVLER